MASHSSIRHGAPDRRRRRGMIPARPTIYNGIQMRSRLEARIAAVLDGMGAEWAYEPQAFASNNGQYLPDFLIKSPAQEFYIEVRPTKEIAERFANRETSIL